MEFRNIPDWETLMSVKPYLKVTEYLREYLDEHRPPKSDESIGVRLDTDTDESMDNYDLGRAYIISLEFYMNHVHDKVGGDLSEDEILNRLDHIAPLFKGLAWRGAVEDLKNLVYYYMRQNEKQSF